MAEPFVGEIIMFGGNFAPENYAFCNGQTIAISQNETLYTLIGTTYGGDGVTTFNLPNLQGRVAVNMGQGSGLSNYVLGQLAGVEYVTLTSSQMPSHTHPIGATTHEASHESPAGLLPGQTPGAQYAAPATPTVLTYAPLTSAGGGLPHSNLQPFVAVSFCIALYGVYPSRS